MSNYIRPTESFENLSIPSLTNATLSTDASFFSIREWPILIGAVVGAIGLIILIIASILIWFCCQYANTSNTYRLSEDDSDSCHNFSYEENSKSSALRNEQQRNFSKIDRVLLLRPSAMDLCRDSSRSLSSNLSSNLGLANHLPMNYQLGQSPALLSANSKQIDAQSNDIIDTRYLNLNAQSVVNLY